MTMRTAISIIVVCKNPGRRLITALQSIWEQKTVTPQLIVVDGMSSDGSAEWLRAHQDRIDTLISEPDDGIYHAMNKGLGYVRGEWIFFLGADDRLASNSVIQNCANLLKEPSSEIVCGFVRYDDGRIWRGSNSLQIAYRNFLHHQACFYSADILRNARFDQTLKIQADYDLNLRLYQKGVRIQHIPILISVCDSGGLSDYGTWQNYREEIVVRHRHIAPWKCWIWDLASLARYARKNLRRRANPSPE